MLWFLPEQLNNDYLSLVNLLDFLMFWGGIEKQHRAVMG